MANESRLSNFDKERGDVSVIPRNLLQTIFDLGSECAFPVLWEYFGWFLGGPDKKMQDPRDNGYLEILKNNQKRQAGSMYERLVRQREKAKARWGGEGDGANDATPGASHPALVFSSRRSAIGRCWRMRRSIPSHPP